MDPPANGLLPAPFGLRPKSSNTRSIKLSPRALAARTSASGQSKPCHRQPSPKINLPCACPYHQSGLWTRNIGHRTSDSGLSTLGFRLPMTPSHSPKFKNPRAKYNFQGRSCSITGVGSYVPAKILSNAELEKMVETTDDWITSRTGIKERRIAAKNEFTSDLASQAAQRAMQMAGVTGSQIDLIIVATITPDMPFPSTACLVQQKIGAHRAAAFDVEAACSGFIFGLEIAQQFIMSRTYDTVLVIGAEKLSSIVDWQDRNTCVLFGDGAGAAVLQNRPNTHGLLTAVMGADGRKAELLFMPGGGSRCPASADSVASRLHYLRLEGKETFKNAVQAMQ